MGKKKVRKNYLMGKRNFLKAMAGFGVSASTLPYLSKEAVAEVTDRPDKEVPRLSRLEVKNPEEESPREREPVFYTIPRDEWEYVEGVHDASRNIAKELNGIDSSGLVDTTVTTVVEGGHSKKAVQIQYVDIENITKIIDKSEQGEGEVVDTEIIRRSPSIDLESLQEQIPSRTQGVASNKNGEEIGSKVHDIPVVVKDVTEVEHAYYDTKYRPLLGGCQMSTGRFGGETGTLATPAWYSYPGEEAQHVMMTSGHLVEDTQSPYYQPGGISTRFGARESWVYEQGREDAALINTEHNNSVDYQLASNSGGGKGPIGGVIGKDELKDNEGDQSYTVYKQGRTTGHQKGYIKEIGTSRDLGYIRLSGGANSEPGDSGGPYYRKVGDTYYIAGMNNWGNRDIDGYAAGHIMTDIEDYFLAYVGA